MVKFNLNVKKEDPKVKKMSMLVKKGDMFVKKSGNTIRVFVVATAPSSADMYLIEVSNLELVRKIYGTTTRASINNELAILFGSGDYIAVEDISNYEVAMTLILK